MSTVKKTLSLAALALGAASVMASPASASKKCMKQMDNFMSKHGMSMDDMDNMYHHNVQWRGKGSGWTVGSMTFVTMKGKPGGQYVMRMSKTCRMISDHTTGNMRMQGVSLAPF